MSQPNHSSFCLLFGLFFFFQLETHHILGVGGNPIVSIVSKTCLFSARSVYRALVSSQPSLQTEKPETLWEVIFQSTKTGALEIPVDAKMSHCSPKQRPRFELLVLSSCGVTDGMGKPGIHHIPSSLLEITANIGGGQWEKPPIKVCGA